MNTNKDNLKPAKETTTAKATNKKGNTTMKTTVKDLKNKKDINTPITTATITTDSPENKDNKPTELLCSIIIYDYKLPGHPHKIINAEGKIITLYETTDTTDSFIQDTTPQLADHWQLLIKDSTGNAAILRKNNKAVTDPETDKTYNTLLSFIRNSLAQIHKQLMITDPTLNTPTQKRQPKPDELTDEMAIQALDYLKQNKTPINCTRKTEPKISEKGNAYDKVTYSICFSNNDKF